MHAWNDTQETTDGDLSGFEVWDRTWAIFIIYSLLNSLNFIVGMCNVFLFCFMCINYIFLGFFQVSLALCFVLMFGNSMLLTSYYASSLVTIWVSVL